MWHGHFADEVLKSVWALGLVEEASSGWEESVFVAWGFGPDEPQPSTGGEWLKQSVSRVGGVGHNLPRSPQGPHICMSWTLTAANSLEHQTCTHTHTHRLESVLRHIWTKTHTNRQTLWLLLYFKKWSNASRFLIRRYDSPSSSCCVIINRSGLSSTWIIPPPELSLPAP